MNNMFGPMQAVLVGGWEMIILVLGFFFCVIVVPVCGVVAIIYLTANRSKPKPQPVPASPSPVAPSPLPHAPVVPASPQMGQPVPLAAKTVVMPRQCPQCGAVLQPDTPEGLCPSCLLQRGFQTEVASASGPADSNQPPPGASPLPFVPPTIDDLAKLFPQLEILECLGRGGMGAVYKARQPRLDRFVALKILAPEKQHDPQFAERFEREARVLAKLSHPNIVSIFDFGEVQGRFYLLMEFVDGLTLRQVMQAGKISAAQALELVPKICEALQYAHGQGIVHRDIKPENILLDKQGHLKIADFGIAKIAGVDGTGLSLTGARDVMGTPHYMAPEQVEKPQTVDHRADIYSLGVVFYEMLTGELPLGKFAPPSKKVQVDVRLDEVVLHALEKEPARRYQQASQVKTAVENVASGRASGLGRPAPMSDTATDVSDKAILPAFLLALFFGVFGAHRFYAGKFVTACLQLLALATGVFFIICCAIINVERAKILFGILLAVTVCGCFFWACIDCLLLVCKAFRDGQGRRMAHWVHPTGDSAKTNAAPPAGQSPVAPIASMKPSADPSGILVAPAVVLMIAGLWKVFSSFIGLLTLAGIGGGLFAIPGLGNIFGAWSAVAMSHAILFQFIPGCLIIFGGWQMLQRRSYTWAVAAGILAILACSLIGLGAGIWALIVLMRDDVKSAFGVSGPGAAAPARSGPFWSRIAAVAACVILIPVMLLVVGLATVAVAAPKYFKEHVATPTLTPEELAKAGIRQEGGEFRKDSTQSLPLDANGRFSIDNVDGRIEVHGWSSNAVKLTATIHGRTAEGVNAVRFKVDSDPGRTAIHTEHSRNFNAFQWNWDWLKTMLGGEANVDYIVQVPEHVTSADASSVDGSVVIDGIAGDITASTVDGGIRIKNAGHNLNLKSVDGSITAEMTSLGAGQSVTLHSVDGSIALTLPEDADAAFSVTTVDGSITSEFPSLQPKEAVAGNNLSGSLGHGSAKVTANAVDGGIRFLKRPIQLESAAPTPAPAPPAPPTPPQTH